MIMTMVMMMMMVKKIIVVLEAVFFVKLELHHSLRAGGLFLVVGVDLCLIIASPLTYVVMCWELTSDLL